MIQKKESIFQDFGCRRKSQTNLTEGKTLCKLMDV